jgi:hypothetical protein
MAHNLSYQVKTLSAIAPSAGSTGTMTAIAVSCAGYDRVMYICNLGTAGTGGTVDMKITECSTSDGTYADISGAILTQVTKAAGDGKTEIIDVPVNPAKPFQKVVLVVGTAAFPNGVDAVLYRGSRMIPPTADGQRVVVT